MLGVFLVLAVGGATEGMAQTPTATIENGSGSIVMESYEDGGLWVPGTFGTGTIPATGVGTRLMWYPAKAAFRAGRAGDGTDGLEWNDTNVGDYSVAFGRNTIASGLYSVAFGDEARASATAATAAGGQTQALQTGATALGLGTTADAQAATALGSGSTVTGEDGTAMGEETTSSARGATAMGQGTSAGAVGALTTGICNNTSSSILFAVGNGSFSSGNCDSYSDALVLDNNGNFSIDGVFESGPTGSVYAGHFRGTKNQTDAGGPDSHIALVENTDTGISASGLAIQTGANTDPVGGNNYLTFYDGDGDPIGGVEGNGSGGVNYSSGAADFAEELPVAQGASIPDAADLVGVYGKTVRLRTDNANRVMIVSRAPLVTGNTTPTTTADDDRRVPVAFIGQVPVRLRGEAEVGDLIVASGRSDGTARAVAPANYRRAEHGPIAGEAWAEKTTEDLGTVTVAVGLDHSGAVAKQMQEQQTRIDSLEREVQRLDRIEKRLARLEQSEDPVAAALPGGRLLFAFLLGGVLGAGLFWRRRA